MESNDILEPGFIKKDISDHINRVILHLDLMIVKKKLDDFKACVEFSKKILYYIMRV